MRENLFRAKRKKDGKWVEGYYIYSIVPKIGWSGIADLEDDQHMIMQEHLAYWNRKQDKMYYEINPETLCQYTGLTDKNGNKIWENDVVKYEDAECDAEGYHDNVFVNIGKVVISPQGVFFTNRQTVDMDDLWLSDHSVEAEVIGTIFDND